MSPNSVNNFTVIDSVFGKFIVNRHCSYQAEYLIKTGKPHIINEITSLLAITNTLGTNCVVVDVGANIGLISVPIAQQIQAKQGIVIAYEPQRMLFYALSGAAALNDLENLYAIHAAIGQAPGYLKLPVIDYAVPQDFGEISLQDNGKPLTGETVEVRSLDTQSFNRIDLLKIDVEGMEMDVLAGASKSIKKFSPWIWIEHHKNDINNIINFIGRDYYKFIVMDDLNMFCAPTERLALSKLSIIGKEV
jgi:FkbM family methyltransferase